MELLFTQGSLVPPSGDVAVLRGCEGILSECMFDAPCACANLSAKSDVKYFKDVMINNTSYNIKF